MSFEVQCSILALAFFAAPLALRMLAAGRERKLESPWLRPSRAKDRFTELQASMIVAVVVACAVLLGWHLYAEVWPGPVHVGGLGEPATSAAPFGPTLRRGAALTVALLLGAFGLESWVAWFPGVRAAR